MPGTLRYWISTFRQTAAATVSSSSLLARDVSIPRGIPWPVCLTQFPSSFPAVVGFAKQRSLPDLGDSRLRMSSKLPSISFRFSFSTEL